ncbi:MAG: tail fiber domain-containing protein, partial [Bacteroidota bacterium]
WLGLMLYTTSYLPPTAFKSSSSHPSQSIFKVHYVLQDTARAYLDALDKGVLFEDLNEGLRFVRIEAGIDCVSDQDVRLGIQYKGNANNGDDYRGPGEVIIPAGKTSKIFLVQIINDDVLEGLETIEVRLSSAENAIPNLNHKIEIDIVDDILAAIKPSGEKTSLRGVNSLNVGLGSSQGDRRNTVYGDTAGNSLSTGDDNVMIGFAAGQRITSGLNNVYIGHKAGSAPQLNSDPDNIGIGKNVLSTPIANGTDLVIIGAFAGEMDSGTDNIMIGKDAGRLSRTGSDDNTFIGTEAGEHHGDAGDDNTYVGDQAGRGGNNPGDLTIDSDDNTFIGSRAGYQIKGGFRNTAVGNEAMLDITVGFRNTAVGDSAGVDLSDGNWNTFIGQGAGAATEHADQNTFVGWFSGFNNNISGAVTTTANRNTYFGARAGFTNREGEDNLGIGSFADFININCSDNVFLGADTRVDNDGSVVVGYRSRSFEDYGIALGYISSVNATRSIALGYNNEINDNASSDAITIGRSISITNQPNSVSISNQEAASAANTILLGNSATSSIGGIVNWTATSDGRIKQSITENVPGLDFIRLLKPVSYQLDLEAIWKLKGITPLEDLQESIAKQSQRIYSGFLAQEVEQSAQELGYSFSGLYHPQNDQDHYGLRYSTFVVPLVQAVKELSSDLDQHQKQLNQQTEKASTLDQKYLELQRRVEALKENQ